MKKQILLFPLLLIAFVFTGCSDDNNDPAPVNEEEVITTMTVSLTPAGGGTAITLKKTDLDGDGPNAPVYSVSGNLVAGTTYSGVIKVENETETPADNITEEVLEEADEHQFFFTSGGGLDVTTTYADTDDNGNYLGVEFNLTANTASMGTLTVTLRHEPTKPNTGLEDAGGETDIQATFNITVE